VTTSDIGAQSHPSCTAVSERRTTGEQDAEADRKRTGVIQTTSSASVTAVHPAPLGSPYSPRCNTFDSADVHLSTPRSSPTTPLASTLLSQTAPLVNSKTSSSEGDAYSISLGAGVQLRYSEADLCEPTSLTGLVSDPDTLYSIWDDASSAWGNRSPLVVRTIPVAMKHWKAFYSKFKQQRIWDSIKQNWHSFRVSAACTFPIPRYTHTFSGPNGRIRETRKG
jgi:hypothetical protein